MKVKKRRTPKKDLILEEFETKDLGEDMFRSNSSVIIRPKNRIMATSILLPPDLIEKLRIKGARRGIGYQTMLKIIVHEHVDEY